MSYGRKPYYIIGTTWQADETAEVEAFEFFGPTPERGRGNSVVVRRDEIAQLVAGLERSGELAAMLAQGRKMLEEGAAD